MTNNLKPTANNVLNSLGVYFQRENYHHHIFPALKPNLDIWYNKPLYGKIDKKHNTIFPSEAFLVQLPLNNKTLFVLNFVADAFKDLSKYIQNTHKSQRVNLQNSFLEEFEPQEAWINPKELYHEYMSTIYESFISYTDNPLIDNEIRDFETFLHHFLNFTDNIINIYPITLSNFILSKFCPIEISGLTIKIKTLDHAEDELKYENFIKDPNFEFYIKSAGKFGFFVDKNAPWRLVPDVFCQKMKKYMSKRNLTEENLFDTLYYNIIKIELIYLKNYLIQIYNTLTSLKPNPNKRFLRKELDLNSLNKKYKEVFWLKLFLYFRLKESKISLNQKEFNNLKKEIELLYQSTNEETVLTFINEKCKVVIPPLEKENELPRIHEREILKGIKSFTFFGV